MSAVVRSSIHTTPVRVSRQTITIASARVLACPITTREHLSVPVGHPRDQVHLQRAGNPPDRHFAVCRVFGSHYCEPNSQMWQSCFSGRLAQQGHDFLDALAKHMALCRSGAGCRTRRVGGPLGMSVLMVDESRRTLQRIQTGG